MSFIDNLSKRKKKLVLATGTTSDDIKNYITDRINEKIEINPRKEGRPESAIYPSPYGLAPIEDMGRRIDTVTGRIVDDGTISRDVAMIIWEEIYAFGRKTIDELVERYRGYDKNLLQIVVNLMIQSHYLKQYKERDGVMTLEILTEDEREKKLKPKKPKLKKSEGKLDTK